MSENIRKAIFAGSFDPITNGHLDIINRASKLYDELYVGVLINPNKKGLFSFSERIDLIEKCVKHLDNVKIIGFNGLLVDYCKKENIDVLVRAIRNSSDVDYELQIAHVNKELSPNIETMIMITNPKYSFVSSSIIKDVARFNGDINNLVPETVACAIKDKLKDI